jgi:hypothetical protein
MISSQKRNFIPFYILGVFFLGVFVFLNHYNKYHLFYLEQIQLFRYNWNYFEDFLSHPGGIAEYLGSFLTQFFVIPSCGAVIVTILAIILFGITNSLLKKFHVTGILWSLIPVVLMVTMHSDHLFKIYNTVALILSLSFILLCLFIPNQLLRRTSAYLGFAFLYNITGIYSLLIPIILSLHELFFSRENSKYIAITGNLILGFLIPYLSWNLFYLLPFMESILDPFPIFGKKDSTIILISLISFVPAALVLAHSWMTFNKQDELVYKWNWQNSLAGIIVFSGLIFLIQKTYDTKTEQILSIDHAIQNGDWEKALQRSALFPEPNNLVIFFTNEALLKSGKIADHMFKYRQIGLEGLMLPWSNNNIIPFFGCDIYYYLGYNNEAYRWAFEAMEMNGECPRLLKRLVMTTLINGDLNLASKYLNQLQESQFYHKWADYYLRLIKNPELINQESEINQHRSLLIKNDFFSGSGKTPLSLEKLLENHPNNKSAFEYYIAELLLKKDLLSFVDALSRLKEMGYTKLPVSYEEVILWYIGYSKQNIIPEGFNIRTSTLEQFKKYLYAYNHNQSSPELMAKNLEKEFGSTYWYYYHFMNNPKPRK